MSELSFTQTGANLYNQFLLECGATSAPEGAPGITITGPAPSAE